MLLGHALEEIRRNPEPAMLLIENFDLVTLARANIAAEVVGSSLSDLLRAAIDNFLGGASEEDWMQLVGRLQKGEGSPAVCVNLMLRRYLREMATDGCDC